MTAQVIWIHKDYYPDWQTRHKLEWIQEQLTYYHAEIAYQSRHLDDNQKRLYKEQSHQNLRKEIHIVKNLVD